MSSQKTSQPARAPQRKRGHERVASLLAAAADCFVEKGYDAATMTEIAARAGASIGSLYQFFPTKESVAQALMSGHADALYDRIGQLAERASEWDDAELAGQLVRLFVDFRRQHPSFVVLTEVVASTPQEDVLTIRMRIRADLTALLAVRFPQLSATQARAAATVVQYMMKAAVAMHAEAASAARTAAHAQLRHALQLYLQDLATSAA
jgi:AcrR family transcriptional regulator